MSGDCRHLSQIVTLDRSRLTDRIGRLSRRIVLTILGGLDMALGR